MENYRTPYFAKTGINEREYQRVLGEALATARADAPCLWAPKRKYQSQMATMAFDSYRKGLDN